jgi:(1->4)-alpha-D-glucan 1-alpha-D-glucosylmutase
LRIPLATYRLQFNPGFGFCDAQELLDYLEKLGVTELYSSPLLKARAGSQHGYDVTDPTQLNPQLGSVGDFEKLVGGLLKRQMGLILDIVPNHMAADPQNPWWSDLLENGHASPFADYFDLQWHRLPHGAKAEHKLLRPVLAAPFERVLTNQELVLALDRSGFWSGWTIILLSTRWIRALT